MARTPRPAAPALQAPDPKPVAGPLPQPEKRRRVVPPRYRRQEGESAGSKIDFPEIEAPSPMECLIPLHRKQG
jgi:hypothetical protein